MSKQVVPSFLIVALAIWLAWHWAASAEQAAYLRGALQEETRQKTIAQEKYQGCARESIHPLFLWGVSCPEGCTCQDNPEKPEKPIVVWCGGSRHSGLPQ